MSRTRVMLGLVAVVVAIILQTTLFGAGRIEPLGVAPALVVLVVILVAPLIEPEYELLLGFTAGILMDLVGSGTLGLWAMSLTSVAYAASRLRERMAQGPLLIAAIVIGLTVLGQIVFILTSTLFGQNTIAEPQLVAKVVLPAAWNLLLAFPVLWLIKSVLTPKKRRWAV